MFYMFLPNSWPAIVNHVWKCLRSNWMRKNINKNEKKILEKIIWKYGEYVQPIWAQTALNHWQKRKDKNVALFFKKFALSRKFQVRCVAQAAWVKLEQYTNRERDHKTPNHLNHTESHQIQFQSIFFRLNNKFYCNKKKF